MRIHNTRTGFIILAILLASCDRDNDQGEILKYYGDAKDNSGYSLTLSGNAYYICGYVTALTRTPDRGITGSSRKMCVIKTGLNGNTIWERYYGEGVEGTGSKIITAGSDSVICVGQVTDTLTHETDMIIVKSGVDEGNAVEKILHLDGNQSAFDIIDTPEGYLVLGSTDTERLPLTVNTGNIAGKSDILLVRIGHGLEPVAEPSSLGYPGNDTGVAIKHDKGGGYVIVGTTDKTEPGKSGINVFLIRINSDGSPTEPVIVGTSDDEYAADIEVLDDGYMIASSTGQTGSGQSCRLFRMSDDIYSGPLNVWSSPVVGSWSANALTRYKSSSFVVAGRSGSALSSRMLAFIADADGIAVEGKETLRGNAGFMTANDVLVDNDNCIVIVGSKSTENNSLIALLKFRME